MAFPCSLAPWNPLSSCQSDVMHSACYISHMLKTLQWLLTIRKKSLTWPTRPTVSDPCLQPQSPCLPSSSILAPFLRIRLSKLSSSSEPLYFMLSMLVCSWPDSSLLSFSSQLKKCQRGLTRVSRVVPSNPVTLSNDTTLFTFFLELTTK